MTKVDLSKGPNELARAATHAADYLRSPGTSSHYTGERDKIGNVITPIFIVLGSGCDSVANAIKPIATIPYKIIPHMPQSTVEGHKGELILGTYQGKHVAGFRGRQHTYEGYSPQEASFMVYLAREFGAQLGIMTCAVGLAPKLDGSYEIGPNQLALIESYFPNFLGSSLRGPISKDVGPRFNGTINVPGAYATHLAQEIGKRNDIDLKNGILVPRQGPNYETAAEVNLLTAMSHIFKKPVFGGMSTVPELEACSVLGIEALAIAVVTNHMFTLDHRQRLEKEMREKLGALIDDEGIARHTLNDARDSVIGIAKSYMPSHDEVTKAANDAGTKRDLETVIGGIVRAVRFQ